HKASLASLLPALNSWRRNHQERTTLNAWRYRVAWKPMPTAPSLSSVAGSWLVVVPSEPEDTEIIDAIVQALASAGGQVVRVAVDESEPDRNDVAEAIEQAIADGPPPRGVISLL